MLVILPDGNRIDLANVTYSLTGYTITFNLLTGSNITYVDPNQSPGNAKAVLKQLDNLRMYAAPEGATPILNEGSYVITSISPNEFDLTTTTLTINGSGFTPNAIGVIYLEDWPGGGMDDNGFFYNCTYVSPTEMMAVYGGPGDGVLSGTMAFYYVDAQGNRSNIIKGSNPSGTIITIP
jgi:hypothetical protein